MNKKILVLGSAGLVGSAIVRELKRQGYENLLTPVRKDLDLSDQAATQKYFMENKPDWVFLAAAKVGGIFANNEYRADFILQNLLIQNNVFQSAHEADVERLLFLGSSCIYPKFCDQPIKEDYLLTGTLEPTNEPYAIAKIAGIKTAESFRRQYGRHFYSVMPTNLYGENDNFHPKNGHVIPGLIARMHEAIEKKEPEFKVWGTGTPRREFLYVDDMAKASIFYLTLDGDKPDFVNVGTGEDIPIKDLAFMVAEKMGYEGQIVFDTSMPDGTPLKRLDVSRLHALGWKHEVSLDQGLDKAIDFFKKNYGSTQ